MRDRGRARANTTRSSGEDARTTSAGPEVVVVCVCEIVVGRERVGVGGVARRHVGREHEVVFGCGRDNYVARGQMIVVGSGRGDENG